MINAETDVYAVIGYPVRHSLSPIIQNIAFNYYNLNAIYVAFEVNDLASAIKGVRALGIKGLSVTIPHKVEIMSFLDKVDETAKEIGAVNTVVNKDGKLFGFNTDWLGVILSLKEKGEISKKRFIVLGAGGAARAVVYGLKKEGAEIIILNRTYERGLALANEFKVKALPLEKASEIKAYGLINTTPVGMWPKIEDTPLKKDILKNFSLVMDIVYHPLKTRLLREAEEMGCQTVIGLKMLVYQGAEQFRLWTGKEAPVKEMFKVAKEILKNEKKNPSFK